MTPRVLAVGFYAVNVLCAGARALTGGPAETLTVASGAVEYRIRSEDKTARLEYFGPRGMAPWRMGAQRRGGPLPSLDISGVVDGQPVAREDLEVAFHQASGDVLRIAYRHLRVPLEIEALYSAKGETGVITRTLKLTNRGTKTLQVEALPELTWRLPPGKYALTYLWGGWGQEKQVATEEVGPGRRVLASTRAKLQIIEASQTPVVTSHNGLWHFARQVGGFTDDDLKALAGKGGLIGLHSAGWLISQKSVEWFDAYSRARRAARPPQPRRESFRPPEYDDGKYITDLDAAMRDRWPNSWGYGRPWRENQRQAIEAGAPLPTVEEWAGQVEYVVRLVGDDHILAWDWT
jgi:hypothetical protein